MTKKFFEDWKKRRSMTESIWIGHKCYFTDRNGEKKEYTLTQYLDSTHHNWLTLSFDGEYIEFENNDMYLWSDCVVEKLKNRLRVHRKDILTVKFKKVK
jgi:hypothetical protein